MKILANEIREGYVLVYRDSLWEVTKTPEHTKPGKGVAYVQVEMKELKSGTKANERFNSNSTVEKAFLEELSYQYLYPESDKLVFMNMENFDQIYIDKSVIGDKADYLRDNMQVKIEFYGSEPIHVHLPTYVTLEIKDTNPVVKGASVTSSYKPAILENGVRIMVPPYLANGDRIVVKVSDNSFVERAK
jgi:elongation factor P